MLDFPKSFVILSADYIEIEYEYTRIKRSGNY